MRAMKRLHELDVAKVNFLRLFENGTQTAAEKATHLEPAVRTLRDHWDEDALASCLGRGAQAHMGRPFDARPRPRPRLRPTSRWS